MCSSDLALSGEEPTLGAEPVEEHGEVHGEFVKDAEKILDRKSVV